MNKQEVFNIVSNHLMTQGERAMSEIEGKMQCVYRAPDGKKCAAGCLIPDHLYHPRMEGKNVTHPFLKDALAGFDLVFVDELQQLHDLLTRGDEATDIRELFRVRLIKFAEKHNLMVPGCLHA